MNKTFVSVLGIVFLLTVATMTGATAAEHEEHHPAGEQGAAASTQDSSSSGQMMPRMMEMMGQGKGMMMKGMPCMQPSSPSMKMHMMGEALSGSMMMDPGMMKRMMDREFFLDRVGELGLSPSQVADLKAIRADCRKDNIRNGAEVKIARLELDDLLGEDDWALAEAEKLIRRIEILEGDMKLRHLQAVKKAEKVLTADQLEKARSGAMSTQLEELF